MAIKINTPSIDIRSYTHYIRGLPKIGKTTLFRDIILEEYGDETCGLLIEFGDEDGHLSLDKVQYEAVTQWSASEDEDGNRGFIQLVDDLVNNRKDYNIKIICFDTIDKMVEIAEKYTIRQSVLKTGNPCTSVNEAFGGFSRGKNFLINTIQEQTAKLKRAGYGIFVLGHTKFKTVKDKTTGIEYEQLTSSLTADLDAIFGNTSQMISAITLDKIVEDGRLIGTKRMLHFRDDGLIDCGSRFSGLPDMIELSAENYLKAFKDAVKSSFSKPVSDEEISDLKQKEIEKIEETAIKSETSLSTAKEKIKTTMKTLKSKELITNAGIMKVLNTAGVASPDEITDEITANSILTELQKYGEVS